MKRILLAATLFVAASPAGALEIEKAGGGEVICKARNARDAVHCATVFVLAVRGISPEVTDRLATDAGEAENLEQDLATLRRAMEAAKDAAEASK